MATIPTGQKFHTVKSTVDTENRGSASLNAQRTIFTMQDILDTVVVGGGVDGSGTAGTIVKWLDTNTVTDSIMVETAALITLTGSLSASGNITGVIGTFSGNLSCVNLSASGNVAGVAGIFTGDVSGVAGTFTGVLTGASVTTAGGVGCAAVSATGLIDAGSLDINGVADIQGILTLQSTLVGATAITTTGKLLAARLAVITLETAPATPTSAGELGTVIIALDGIYVAVGVNQWLKAPLVTF